MKITYAIKTVLRLDKIKLDGTVPIHFSVRVGTITTRIPTGKFTFLSDWNQNDKCPKKLTRQGQLLSAYLTKRMSDWNNYMLTEESLGKTVTILKATDFFRENTKVTLFSFWDEQIVLWENYKEANTLKSYRSTLRILKGFNNKLNFGDLTYDVIQKFDVYLAKERGNALGGRFVKHKCLKAIINQAIIKGYMNENPYRHFKIKASTAKRNFLSIEELKKVIAVEIPDNEVFLHKTRDMFLFSSFTGLRYSDVMNLKFGNIKNNPEAITIEMTKTKKPVMVPLVAPAKAIIEKYNKLNIKMPATSVFPYIDNQVLNRNLKDLMKMAGIEKSISFHAARHGFASNHIELGTNIIHLKDLLGHSKLTETQIYAKSLTSDLFKSMDNLQNIYSLKHVG